MSESAAYFLMSLIFHSFINSFKWDEYLKKGEYIKIKLEDKEEGRWMKGCQGYLIIW